MPTIAALEPTFDIKKSTAADDSLKQDSHIIEKLKPISSFGEHLAKCGNECSYSSIIEKIKSMSQSEIDVEIRSLSSQTCGTNELLLYFIEAIIESLKTNRDFEVIQTYLALFLKTHTDEIASDEQLMSKCDELTPLIDESWDRLALEFDKSLCIVNYLRSAVL